METPCVGICHLSPDTGRCDGCGRTVAEIASWASLSDRERRRIMAELPGRRRLAPTKGRV